MHSSQIINLLFLTNLTNLTDSASALRRRCARACRLRRVYSTGWQARALASALREICEICVKFSYLHKNLKIFYNAFSLRGN